MQKYDFRSNFTTLFLARIWYDIKGNQSIGLSVNCRLVIIKCVVFEESCSVGDTEIGNYINDIWQVVCLRWPGMAYILT